MKFFLEKNRPSLPIISLLIIASLFSIFNSYKGFAGFDLSPMISGNNLLTNHLGLNYALSNPMSPGFSFVVYIFTSLFGFTYQSYFFGNILFCLFIYLAGYWLIINLKDVVKPSTLYLLKLQNLAIVIPSLITDGHFYISDTSNIICTFTFLTLECYFLHSIFVDKNDLTVIKNKVLNKFSIAFILALSFVIYLKPNVGLPTLLICGSSFFLFDFLARKDLKSFVLVSPTKLILISFLIVCFSLLLKSCIGFDYNTYVDVIKSVSQHRSGLDFNNISIDIYNGRFLSFDGAVRWTNFIYFCLVTSFLLYLTGIEIYISKYKVLWFLTLVFLYSIHSGFYFTTIVILLALIAALSVKVFIARHKVASYSIDRFFLIFILSSLVLGVVSMLTNYDTKSSDYPLIFFSLIGILIILDLQKNIDYFRARKVLHVFLICFFILFSLEGFTRFKLLLAGPPSNYQDFNSIIDDSFFNKLRTSEYHQDTLKSVDNALKKYKNEETSNRIVFGSRLEYLYAKYQMIPPRGLPLWWHINTSYQVRDVDSIDKVINSDSVKIIIFELIGNQPDTALMDEQTKASIFDNSHFYHDMSFSNLVVLVKK